MEINDDSDERAELIGLFEEIFASPGETAVPSVAEGDSTRPKDETIEALNSSQRVFTLRAGPHDLRADGYEQRHIEPNSIFAQIELQRAARLEKLPPHLRVAGRIETGPERFRRPRV